MDTYAAVLEIKLYKDLIQSHRSKPFDSLIVFLRDFFEKVNFEKKSTEETKTCKIAQHAKS